MWDVDAVPDGPAAAAAGLPAGAFLTCSSDGSVRLWALGPTPAEGGAGDGEPAHPPPAPRSPGGGSALLRVVAAGRELQAVLRLDAAAAAAAAGAPGPPGDGCCDEAAGEARCVRVSPDGRWIAVGDRAGNLRVHALAPSLELQVGCHAGGGPDAH